MKPKPKPDRRPIPEPPPEPLALFAPPPADDPDAADPAALARRAILASGRAMTGRLWAEARALAGLAESYARLGERSKRAAPTVETMDLQLLFEAMNADADVVRERFWIKGDGDPDRAVKQAFWDQRREQMTAARDIQADLMRRVWNAERIAREAGGAPEISAAGEAAEAAAAFWAEVDEADIAADCDGGRSGGEGPSTASGTASPRPSGSSPSP